LAYLPARADRRSDNQIKRQESIELLQKRDALSDSREPGSTRKMTHQIDIDISRTHSADVPAIAQSYAIMKIMERCPTIWLIQNPVCGYVQGMNDIVLPILIVLIEDEKPGQIERR